MTSGWDENDPTATPYGDDGWVDESGKPDLDDDHALGQFDAGAEDVLAPDPAPHDDAGDPTDAAPTGDPTPTPTDPPQAEPGPGAVADGGARFDPAQVADIAPVTAGPRTAPPSADQRGLVPGVTDVAADLGHALGVGSDDLGLVEVEVNGLMGVAVRLSPGLVPLGAEQAGHCLASALEEGRNEVVGHLEEYFRSNESTAEWLNARPTSDDSGLAGGGSAPAPQQRTASSPDGLVTVVVASDGSIGSVMINSADLELAAVGEAFVIAAERALQGSGDGTGMDADARMAEFDKALAKIDKAMDDLDRQLESALKEI